MTAPPAAVLDAFGADQPPVLLAGGQGVTWRSGDLVLKPVDEPVAHAWVCEVFAAWPAGDEVRVPRPVRSGTGAWNVDGWGAHAWLDGATARVGEDPARFRAAADAFHAVVADLPRPAFLDTRSDPWAFGDRVAWQDEDPVGSPAVRDLVGRARAAMTAVDVAPQVVHGDLAGNTLRCPDGVPGIIDWPPYFRPAGWALAVVAVDAVCWQGADPALLESWSDVPAWDQMLLRALVYRVATSGRVDPRYVPVREELVLERMGAA